jgi:uncharacterized membrane protein HdeD (DUF308 family)
MGNRRASFDALSITRGLLSILFGLSALSFLLVPQINLVQVFGLYALLEGALAIVSSFRQGDWLFRRSLLLVEGILNLAIAVLVFAFPPIWSIGLPWLIAVWAILTGALNLFASLRAGGRTTRPWVSLWAGIIRIGYGVPAWFLPSDLPAIGTMSGRFVAFLVLTAAMAILFGAVICTQGSALHPSSRLSIDQPHSS